MNGMYNSLLKKLRNLKWIIWDEKTEGENVHFHASIAHKDIPEDKFEEIINFVKQKNIKIKTKLDNITILKSEEDIWKVHKEFKFGG